MGHTIWVEVQGRPLKETADDSSVMHHLMDKLDDLAVKLQVSKLSDFYDYSELERAYGGLEDDDDFEDEELELSPEEKQLQGSWFDSELGYVALRTLRHHLTDHFEDLEFKPDKSNDHWPGRLLEELKLSETILENAVANHQAFRLLIVP